MCSGYHMPQERQGWIFTELELRVPKFNLIACDWPQMGNVPGRNLATLPGDAQCSLATPRPHTTLVAEDGTNGTRKAGGR